MTLDVRRIIYIIAVWLSPVILVLLEASLFLSRADWTSPYIPYIITFWTTRAPLSPAIAFYALHVLSKFHTISKIFLCHLIGFFIFSLAFWLIAFFILKDILHESAFFGIRTTSTDIGIFSLIVDNSVSTNTIVYASTVGFCYIWKFFNDKIVINKKAIELEKSLLMSRLEHLRGQLNTHFLFNTLHTISSLVVRNQNEEANKMLVKLSDLLRFSLKENKEQFITLQKEFDLLHLYLDIQKIRFKERLQIHLSIDPAASHCEIPSLLLQPIVENAVKYGIEPYSEAGYIEIRVIKKEQSLHISVTDTGRKPFSEINFEHGIGLSNTKNRLEQLYGQKFEFKILPNQSSGVKVNISIPV